MASGGAAVDAGVVSQINPPLAVGVVRVAGGDDALAEIGLFQFRLPNGVFSRSRRLVAEGLANGKTAGIKLSVLVGNESYYARFGFVRVQPGQICFPGPVDPHRILAAALAPDALAGFRGLITAA